MATIFKKLGLAKLPWTCDQCGHVIDPAADGNVYFLSRRTKDTAPEIGTIRCHRCPTAVQCSMRLAEFISYFPENHFEHVRDTSGMNLVNGLEAAGHAPEADAAPDSENRISALEARIATLESEMLRWWQVIQDARRGSNSVGR